MCFIVVAYFVLTINIKYPEEKLHFIEYGCLAFLVFQAISVDVKNQWAYVYAFLFCGIIGWGDEGIQGLLPNRYYELKDIFLNL